MNKRAICLYALFFWTILYVSGQTIKNTRDDFRIKGFHLDLRVQVMKMPALKAFAKQLSAHGINTLIMEWEASYPYQKHRVISNKYAYTREEVRSFISYCNGLGIDVIPLQQSFGHVEYILKHYRYKDLREDQKDYSQVNPLKEEACRALFKDLYTDMIAMHHSPYIHIGGDETYLLGHSEASKAKVARVGMGRLYGDYLKMLCDLVIQLGKRPVVWADIALKYPDALKLLPKETIFVDWNYGWSLDQFGDHEKLMESGFEIWGSPAIRSSPDNYFLTDWAKHFNNIRTFIPQARKLGYKGIVMTSWSTSGIYSPIFESSSDIIGLHAVRRVYPIDGFDMLIAAYWESLKSAEPLPIDEFVLHYAAENYGFGQEESQAFWQALTSTPYEVSQGAVRKNGMTVAELLDSAKATAASLYRLKPTKNKQAYSHYLLMADIRVFYLTCMLVETEMNKADYTTAQASGLEQMLEALHPEQLDKRFIALHGQLLYPSELALENDLRNQRWKDLKDLLEQQLRP